MKKYGILAFLVVFGIPLLLISDWFPLHRFGMFARTEATSVNQAQFKIYTFQSGTWKPFETGNPYFDQSYTHLWAGKAWENPTVSHKLIKTIVAHSDSSLRQVAIEKTELSKTQRRILWKK